MKQLSIEIEKEIGKEETNAKVLRKSQCEYIKSMHNILTLRRKLLEIEISSLLLSKKPTRMKGIMRKFNNARAKRRVYDYLLEICNSTSSKKI
ncbi:MAG TPA: hypothetical protein PKW84_09515 [Fervidobacterium sp.]|nr:hypothetical protein [Fervidobacterium sp.]